jgi:hypothetical protein
MAMQFWTRRKIGLILGSIRNREKNCCDAMSKSQSVPYCG